MEEMFKKKNETTDPPQRVRLFVADIADFSTQYGKEQSKSYTVANLRSGPNHYPRYGDFLESCVLRTYGPWWQVLPSNIQVEVKTQPLFISQDFIEVIFENKLVLESVIIYETYHPGSVCALYAFDYFKNKWYNIWSIFDEFNFVNNQQALNRPLPPKVSRKFEPLLKRKDIFTDKLRLEFEHGKQDYYSEIDAVEIIGYSHDALTSKKIGFNLKKIADSFNFLNLKEKYSDENIKHESSINTVSTFNTIKHSTKSPISIIKSDCESLTNNLHSKAQVTPKIQRSFSLSNKESKRRNLSTSTVPTSASYPLLSSLINCTNITELPNEILNIILSYLDLKTLFNLRSTCKHFYEICSDDYLFQKLNLQAYWHLVDDDFIKLLTNLTKDVKMINLSWTKLTSKNVLEQFFIRSCKSLITLKLDNCLIIDGEILNVIANNCVNLENLSLIGCLNHNNDDFTNTTTFCENKNRNNFMYLKKLKNLINLNLYRSAIDTDSIIQILVSCNRLKHLNLGSCINITDFDLIMDVISENCKQIESLDLWRAYTLTNTGLNKIANNCLNLVELDIGWCRTIHSFDFLKTLVIKCKNLKKLFLTSLRITDEELIFVSKHSPNIEQLDVLGSSISAEAAEIVLRNCKHLKMFDISFCSNTNMDLYAQLRDTYRNCSIKKSFQSEY